MEKRRENMKTQNILLGILVGIALSISAMFYLQTEKAIDAYICDSRPIIVSDGITLFDLVTRNCDGNLGEALDDAVDTYGTNLVVGQQVFLPRNNDCNLRMTDGGEVFEDC
jgi:hypothetical protein